MNKINQSILNFLRKYLPDFIKTNIAAIISFFGSTTTTISKYIISKKCQQFNLEIFHYFLNTYTENELWKAKSNFVEKIDHLMNDVSTCLHSVFALFVTYNGITKSQMS